MFSLQFSPATILQVHLCCHSSGGTKVLVVSSLSKCYGPITCEDLYSWCTSLWCCLCSCLVPPLLPHSEGCVKPSAVRGRNLLRGIHYLNYSVFEACPLTFQGLISDFSLVCIWWRLESSCKGRALSALSPLRSATVMRNKDNSTGKYLREKPQNKGCPLQPCKFFI